MRQFIVLTSVDDATAISCLNQHDWRLELAANSFFENPERYIVKPPAPTVDRRKLDALFTKYRG